jgi:hypothetical protein
MVASTKKIAVFPGAAQLRIASALDASARCKEDLGWAASKHVADIECGRLAA